jgi:Na+/H+ antiporter NhaD/arsenite permease-like protein
MLYEQLNGVTMLSDNVSAMIVVAIILIVTYILISTEKMNKTLAALLGAIGIIIFVKATAIATGFEVEIFTDAELFGEIIDWRTITIVVSVLVIVEVSRTSGLFDWITIRIIKLTEGEPTKIFLYMNLLTFGLAALLGAVAAFIIVGALTLVVTRNMQLDPQPFIISEIMVANSAGVSTVISSFVNILIAARYQLAPEHFLTYEGFIVLGLPIGALLVVTNLFLFKLLYGKKIQEEAANASMDLKASLLGLDEWQVVRSRPIFYRSAILLIGTIVAFIIASFIAIPFYVVALTSAILFILFSGIRIEIILRKLDWEMAIFFVGIFIIVGGAHKVGLLELFAESIGTAAGGNKYVLWIILIWLSAVLSGFMDNISVAAVLVFVIPTLAAIGFNETSIIWAVILGANLGANITPIGGVANIVAVSLLEKEGTHISWFEFIKLGGIITIANLAVATGYIFLLSAILGW